MSLDRQQKFKNIYDEYADAIFRHIYFKLGDRERALELTQEVFARLWQYLASGKDIEFPKAFLYRSATNIFINEIRTDKRTVSLDTLLEAGFEVAYEGKDLQEIAEQKEVVDRLQELDGHYRDVLTMRYIEDMQVKEIASVLGEKENTVSVWIKRGLEKLKKIYG